MKGAHHMRYKLLSGIKNDFILKFFLIETVGDVGPLRSKIKKEYCKIISF